MSDKNKKKLIYIAFARMPTHKAHGVQISRMCEAFANNGLQVELLVPFRKNVIKEDVFSFYGIKNRYKITTIFIPDLVCLGRVGFLISYSLFSLVAFLYTVFKKVDIVFSREYFPLLWLTKWKKTTIYEMHDFPTSHLNTAEKICKSASQIITTNKWAKNKIIDFFHISEEKILSHPNGVDLELFQPSISQKEARNKLGLPENKKIVLYTGSLYEWKGINILAKATDFLNDDIKIVFVGGVSEETEKMKKKYPKNIFIPQQSYLKIPLFLVAADVLVVPNIPSTQHSSFSTSPIKLFEYMASKKPVVISDLPSMREIVDERSAILVKPGDPKDLAEGILKALNDKEKVSMLIKNAYIQVLEFSWSKRTQAIIDHAFNK